MRPDDNHRHYGPIPRRVAASRFRTLALALVLLVLAVPALAQMPMQMINPFAGRMGGMSPGAMAPYGSRAGAMPHVLNSTNGMTMSMGGSMSGFMDRLASAFGMEGIHTAMPTGMEGTGRHVVPGGEEGIEGELAETEVGGAFLELIVGACAGGAFIGVFAAATAVEAAAPVVAPAAAAAAPLAITGLAAASGIGCGLGVVTVTVSLAAIFAYREIAE